jgi:hypothetical protein
MRLHVGGNHANFIFRQTNKEGAIFDNLDDSAR